MAQQERTIVMTDPTSTKLVTSIEGASDVAVERDHTYPTTHGPLGFDLYRPPQATAPCPVVVIVTGLPDPGVAAMLGKPLKDWESYRGWARAIAASGIAAIAYLNREPSDVFALVRHVRANAGALGIDPARIAVWSASGSVPMALGLIAQERLACAVLMYGYLLDLPGSTTVADASRTFYFAMPPVALDDLPRDVPMLVVRAGRDTTPGLDATLLAFVAAARDRGLPVSLIEHADGPHSFDLVDDSPRTHAVIHEVLAFLREHLASNPV
jgi:acetyl esterase/lipase